MSRELEVIEFVAERMKRDPKVQAIVADAHLFDSLRENSAWKRLYEKVMAQKERYMRGLAERLMGPKYRHPSPEEIAFHKGYYQGAVNVLIAPEVAELNLERAARIAWLLVNQEFDKIEEEESPYA